MIYLNVLYVNITTLEHIALASNCSTTLLSFVRMHTCASPPVATFLLSQLDISLSLST
jgi:hypothetical protein